MDSRLRGNDESVVARMGAKRNPGLALAAAPGFCWRSIPGYWLSSELRYDLPDHLLPFDLTIPQTGAQPTTLSISVGETIFILGANGTGKSALMQRINTGHNQNVRRISAHRQTWFESNSLSVTAADRRNLENNINNWDRSADSTLAGAWCCESSQSRNL